MFVRNISYLSRICKFRLIWYNEYIMGEHTIDGWLDEALIEYGASDIYPFHMPGHKRQKLGDFTPEEIDITEVGDFDDLHHAEGILRGGQERLARLAGADESFYLVNGSTAGILAAVCGCVKKGGRILIARNCHKSVYYAAYLAEARPEYLYPEPAGSGDFMIPGSISPIRVGEALRSFPDVQAVVITSPTYDGVVSDIRAIADIVHDRDIPLIVDEAHGAHFGFADCFPPKASVLGADLCVESLHKTLPAYTQSAALHMKRTDECGKAADPDEAGPKADDRTGYRFDAGRVRRFLDIFQSSSPSYVLMAGIDRCVRMIGEDEELYRSPETRPESLFGKFEERLRCFYAQCAELSAVRVFPGGSSAAGADTQPGIAASGIYDRDSSKILICAEAAGLHGQQLYDLLLDKYHLQMEMAAGSYVTALTSVMDTDEGFERLFTALAEIDRAAGSAREASGQAGTALLCLTDTAPRKAPDDAFFYGPGEKRLEIAQAMDSESAPLPLSEAAGRVTAEFVYLYPPGVPILVPGEVITGEIIRQLMRCESCGMRIRGMRDPDGQAIFVVPE